MAASEMDDVDAFHSHVGLADTSVTSRYDLEEELGSGEFGVVWKALDRATGEEVLIKKITQGLGSAEKMQRTYREVLVLQSLSDRDESQLRLVNTVRSNGGSDLYLILQSQPDGASSSSNMPLKDALEQQLGVQFPAMPMSISSVRAASQSPERQRPAVASSSSPHTSPSSPTRANNNPEEIQQEDAGVGLSSSPRIINQSSPVQAPSVVHHDNSATLAPHLPVSGVQNISIPAPPPRSALPPLQARPPAASSRPGSNTPVRPSQTAILQAQIQLQHQVQQQHQKMAAMNQDQADAIQSFSSAPSPMPSFASPSPPQLQQQQQQRMQQFQLPQTPLPLPPSPSPFSLAVPQLRPNNSNTMSSSQQFDFGFGATPNPDFFPTPVREYVQQQRVPSQNQRQVRFPQQQQQQYSPQPSPSSALVPFDPNSLQQQQEQQDIPQIPFSPRNALPALEGPLPRQPPVAARGRQLQALEGDYPQQQQQLQLQEPLFQLRTPVPSIQLNGKRFRSEIQNDFNNGMMSIMPSSSSSSSAGSQFQFSSHPSAAPMPSQQQIQQQQQQQGNPEFPSLGLKAFSKAAWQVVRSRAHQGKDWWLTRRRRDQILIGIAIAHIICFWIAFGFAAFAYNRLNLSSNQVTSPMFVVSSDSSSPSATLYNSASSGGGLAVASTGRTLFSAEIDSTAAVVSSDALFASRLYSPAAFSSPSSVFSDSFALPDSEAASSSVSSKVVATTPVTLRVGGAAQPGSYRLSVQSVDSPVAMAAATTGASADALMRLSSASGRAVISLDSGSSASSYRVINDNGELSIRGPSGESTKLMQMSASGGTVINTTLSVSGGRPSSSITPLLRLDASQSGSQVLVNGDSRLIGASVLDASASGKSVSIIGKTIFSASSAGQDITFNGPTTFVSPSSPVSLQNTALSMTYASAPSLLTFPLQAAITSGSSSFQLLASDVSASSIFVGTSLSFDAGPILDSRIITTISCSSGVGAMCTLGVDRPFSFAHATTAVLRRVSPQMYVQETSTGKVQLSIANNIMAIGSDLSVMGLTHLSNGVSVDGGLSVVSGSLTVSSGAAIFNQGVSVSSGKFTVDNNGAVASTSSLTVAGASSLAGVSASGPATFGSTLSVPSGLASLQTVQTSGNTAIQGQLFVGTGCTTASCASPKFAVDASGNIATAASSLASFGGALQTVGDVAIGGTIASGTAKAAVSSTSGNAVFQGSLAAGAASLASVAVSGAASVTGNMVISGSSQITGPLSTQGSFQAGPVTTRLSFDSVTGSFFLPGSLNATFARSFLQAVSAQSLSLSADLSVPSGSTTLSSTQINGNLALQSSMFVGAGCTPSASTSCTGGAPKFSIDAATGNVITTGTISAASLTLTNAVVSALPTIQSNGASAFQAGLYVGAGCTSAGGVSSCTGGSPKLLIDVNGALSTQSLLTASSGITTTSLSVTAGLTSVQTAQFSSMATLQGGLQIGPSASCSSGSCAAPKLSVDSLGNLMTLGSLSVAAGLTLPSGSLSLTTGNVLITAGTLQVTAGATTLAALTAGASSVSSLTVSGASTLSGAVTASGGLSLTGGSLTVSVPSTLAQLDSGNHFANGILKAGGPCTSSACANPALQADASTVTANLGLTVAGGNFRVSSGSTTLQAVSAGNINVGTITAASSTLSALAVSGASTLSGAVTAAGGLSVTSGTLSSTVPSSLAQLDVTNTFINGVLRVGGPCTSGSCANPILLVDGTTVTSNFGITVAGGGFKVTSGASQLAALSTSGAASLASLSVTGTSSLSGLATASAGLSVTGGSLVSTVPSSFAQVDATNTFINGVLKAGTCTSASCPTPTLQVDSSAASVTSLTVTGASFKVASGTTNLQTFTATTAQLSSTLALQSSVFVGPGCTPSGGASCVGGAAKFSVDGATGAIDTAGAVSAAGGVSISSGGLAVSNGAVSFTTASGFSVPNSLTSLSNTQISGPIALQNTLYLGAGCIVSGGASSCTGGAAKFSVDINGNVVYAGTSSAGGLISGANGITISSGLASLQAVQTAGNVAVQGQFFVGAGCLSSSCGSPKFSVDAVGATSIAGLLTAQAGATVSSGNVVVSSGSLTVSTGSTSLTTLQSSGNAAFQASVFIGPGCTSASCASPKFSVDTSGNTLVSGISAFQSTLNVGSNCNPTNLAACSLGSPRASIDGTTGSFMTQGTALIVGNTAINGALFIGPSCTASSCGLPKLSVDTSGNTLVAGTLTANGLLSAASDVQFSAKLVSAGNVFVGTGCTASSSGSCGPTFTITAASGNAATLGSLTVGTTLTATGAATLSSSLDVASTVLLRADLWVASACTLTQISAGTCTTPLLRAAVGTSTVSVGGALTVATTSTFTSTATFNGPIVSSGTVQLGTGGMNVVSQGNLQLGASCTPSSCASPVFSVAVGTGNTAISGSLTSTGAVSANGGLSTTTLAVSALSSLSSVQVSGAATLQAGIQFGPSASCTFASCPAPKLSIDSANGNTMTLGSLSVAGGVTLPAGNLAVSVGNVQVTAGTLTVGGSTSLAALSTSSTATLASLSVSGVSTLSGLVTAPNGITITGGSLSLANTVGASFKTADAENLFVLTAFKAGGSCTSASCTTPALLADVTQVTMNPVVTANAGLTIAGGNFKVTTGTTTLQGAVTMTAALTAAATSVTTLSASSTSSFTGLMTSVGGVTITGGSFAVANAVASTLAQLDSSNHAVNGILKVGASCTVATCATPSLQADASSVTATALTAASVTVSTGNFAVSTGTSTLQTLSAQSTTLNTLTLSSTSTFNGLLTANAGIKLQTAGKLDTTGVSFDAGNVWVQGTFKTAGSACTSAACATPILSVDSSTVTAAALTVSTGNAVISSGNLGITSGTLTVGGASTISGLLTLNAGLKLQTAGKLDTSAVSTDAGNTWITGTLKIASASCSSTACASPILDVGAALVTATALTVSTGSLTVSAGNLAVTAGSATIGGALSVTGASSLSTLSLSSTSVFSGLLTANAGIKLQTAGKLDTTAVSFDAGNTWVSGSFKVAAATCSSAACATPILDVGASVVTAAALTVSTGALTVSTGNVVVTSGSLTLTAGSASIGGTLGVTGASTLTSLSVSSTSALTGLVTANGGLKLQTAGKLDTMSVPTDAGNTWVQGTLKVAGFACTSTACATPILDVGAAVVTASALTVSNNLIVSGTTTLTGLLTGTTLKTTAAVAAANLYVSTAVGCLPGACAGGDRKFFVDGANGDVLSLGSISAASLSATGGGAIATTGAISAGSATITGALSTATFAASGASTFSGTLTAAASLTVSSGNLLVSSGNMKATTADTTSHTAIQGNLMVGSACTSASTTCATARLQADGTTGLVTVNTDDSVSSSSMFQLLAPGTNAFLGYRSFRTTVTTLSDGAPRVITLATPPTGTVMFVIENIYVTVPSTASVTLTGSVTKVAFQVSTSQTVLATSANSIQCVTPYFVTGSGTNWYAGGTCYTPAVSGSSSWPVSNMVVPGMVIVDVNAPNLNVYLLKDAVGSAAISTADVVVFYRVIG